jgi:hypothetical protein
MKTSTVDQDKEEQIEDNVGVSPSFETDAEKDKREFIGL